MRFENVWKAGRPLERTASCRSTARGWLFGAVLALSSFATSAETEISFYYPVAVGGPITKIVDAYAAGNREAAVAAYARWLPLINFENRQGGLLSAKALMQEGGVIACEAPRDPFPAMHPATRAGLIETARRLDPLVLRWAR